MVPCRRSKTASWVLFLLLQGVLGLFSPGHEATPRALLAQPSSRRALLAGLGVAPAAAAAAASAPRRDGIVSPTGATTLEVARCGGALCVDYEVDGGAFSAVLDTGSPFLLVDGSCGNRRRASEWGCYPSRVPYGLFGRQGSLNDASLEGYGGQQTTVEWRRGLVELGGAPQRGAAGLALEPAIFGAIRSFEGQGGAGAVYLGLIKNRQARVRPTFLEQTDVASLELDLRRRRAPERDAAAAREPRRGALTLARRPRVQRGALHAVRLLDLRALGAPVAPYAARVARLFVNGERVRLARPTLAIVDTGTTGLSVTDTLLESDELPLPGAAIKDVRVELEPERAGAPPVALAATARKLEPSGERPEFPLIVTPCKIPWFDDDFRFGRRGARSTRATPDGEAGVAATRAALGERPHLLFVGLAFLSNTRLTIDVDAGRMTAEGVTEGLPTPRLFRRRSMYADIDARTAGAS